jgi:uncharacterized protein (DUF305 family)
MRNASGQSRVVFLVTAAIVGGAACGPAAMQQSSPQSPPPIVQPGAPGEPSRVIDRKTAESLTSPGHTAADVTFMQGMIGHHAQAIEMVELLKTRTNSDEMRKLAERIEVSQTDEMKMMREWLEARGAERPADHAHHAPGGRMPGMLAPEEMAKLAAAKGPEFDELFLKYMIRHHEGAIIMVRDLFATPGAGQESEIYTFASDVVADQRMEIARMAAMLKELQK